MGHHGGGKIRWRFFPMRWGHSALTGIGIGVILGIGNVNLIMIVFAILFCAASE